MLHFYNFSCEKFMQEPFYLASVRIRENLCSRELIIGIIICVLFRMMGTSCYVSMRVNLLVNYYSVKWPATACQ